MYFCYSYGNTRTRPLSDEEIIAEFLPIDADAQQGESDEDDSQSENSEVFVNPNPSQLRAAIDTLMNYSMIVGTAELQGLTVNASKIIENINKKSCETKMYNRLFDAYCISFLMMKIFL